MNAQIVLTPAEAKRLIAKAVVNLPSVRKALQHGIVAVGKGSTNAYVAEELLGCAIDKKRYVIGMRLPAKSDRSWIPEGRLSDIVLRNGQLVPNAAVTEIVKEMGRGDVLIKGANALEPSRRMAGIYVGHNMGGTIGATWGIAVARGVRMVIPVGLEKLVGSSMADLAAHFLAAEYDDDENVGFMPVTGEIITEIEALQSLCGVDALHTGSGGLGGAEGSTHFLLSGDREAVATAVRLVQAVQGEPPFASL